MIRKFVYAKKSSHQPSHASHWTADGSDVTVHFADGRDSVKLPDYHTPETLVNKSFNAIGDDSIVVESVEPWQAEVERLKGELAIAEKKAAAYEDLVYRPAGNLSGDARRAELLGMKTGSGTFSSDFLAFIKELIAERDAARAEAKRFEGSQGSASAWKALNARGDLKGIQKPTCRDDILALVDQLKAKNSEVEEACKDLKAAIADSLNRDGEAIPSADMILAGVRYINGLKKKLKSQCPTWHTLCETYGMPVIQGRSASDDIFNFVASLKAKVAESESSGSRIAEALGLDKDADCDAAAAAIGNLQLAHGGMQATWNDLIRLCRSQGMTEYGPETVKDSILRHIRNQESANGHLADEVSRMQCEVSRIHAHNLSVAADSECNRSRAALFSSKVIKAQAALADIKALAEKAVL